MTVAIQGAKGSFSERAAMTLFGKKRLLYCVTFKETFESLDRGLVTSAILPIENTLTGSIHENFDHLLTYPMTITGEGVLRVSHAMLAKPKTTQKAVREVWSHPQALLQCSKWISSHPKWKTMPVFDTAGASQLLIDSDRTDVAVIAHRDAAKIYGLKIIKDEIENHPHNFTRFIMLSKREGGKIKGPLKTSIIFGCHNRPGSLASILGVFADFGINLIKLESRPIEGKPFAYLFYADIEGGDRFVRSALRMVEKEVQFYKFLGSYPRYC